MLLDLVKHSARLDSTLLYSARLNSAQLGSTQLNSTRLDSARFDTDYVSFIINFSGYGHIVPLTPGGKLFCTFFAAFGIPFTLVFLSASVQRLLFPTLRFLAWMMSGKLGNVMSPLGVRLVHLLLLAAMVGDQIASKSLHIVRL